MSRTTMVKNEWQRIPGTEKAEAFPYIRRPDVLSCNSYLIEYPKILLLVDPGALPCQTRELRMRMDARDPDRAKPRMVLLTHCHFDHSREAKAFVEDPARPAWLAVQEDGARALSDGDRRSTAYDLYGMRLEPISPHLVLLGESDLLHRRAVRVDCPGICGLLRPLRAPGHPVPVSQVLEFGDSHVEIHACPGHSPDSVCYRIGEWLMIGDLLVASRPFVAGIRGWDASRLAQSIDWMIHLLETERISWCCPAHGDPLPAAKTLDLLRKQRAVVTGGGDIEEMNPDRLQRAVDIAMEIIDETEEVFAAIAGRLLYIADRMDMLEEPETAQRCRDAMDLAGVDSLIDAFRRQMRALESGDMLPVSLAIEVTGVIEKLQRHLSSEFMNAILPATLVHHARRMLLDFLGIAKGVQNPEEFIPVGTGVLLDQVEQAWKESPHLDGEWIHAADEPEAFAAELARRIGHPPLSHRLPVAFSAQPPSMVIQAAAARFCDTMVQFLEWLGRAGATSLEVALCSNGTLDIHPYGWNPGNSPHMESKLRSFGRRFARAGFRLGSIGPDGCQLVPAGDDGRVPIGRNPPRMR